MPIDTRQLPNKMDDGEYKRVEFDLCLNFKADFKLVFALEQDGRRYGTVENLKYMAHDQSVRT